MDRLLWTNRGQWYCGSDRSGFVGLSRWLPALSPFAAKDGTFYLLKNLICSKCIGRSSDSPWDEEGPFCFITITKGSNAYSYPVQPSYIQCIQSPLDRMDTGLRKLINLPYSPISFRNCNNMGYHIRSSGTSRR